MTWIVRQFRWLLILLAVLCMDSGVVKTVYADTLPELDIPDEQKYTVGYIQQSIPIYIYKDVPVTVDLDTAQIRHGILSYIRNHPYLLLLQDEHLNAISPEESNQDDTFMQSEIDMGYAENLMSNFNYGLAISVLQRVVQNFVQSLTNYTRPRFTARAYQMLAYSYIGQMDEAPEQEDNLRHLATQAFIELIRLAPHLTMLAGRQSPTRVEIYDDALSLFLGNESYRQTPQRDATAIAHKINSDIVVFFRIVQKRNGAFQLEIDRYNMRESNMEYAIIPLDELPGIPVSEQAQYIINATTAWLSNDFDCLEVHLPEPPAPDFHRFYFDIMPMYGLFAKYPTSNIVHTIGGSVSLSFMFDRYFYVRGTIEILAALPDKAHELYDTFSLYRIPLIVGFSNAWPLGRFYLGVGLELSFTADYTMTKSIICKTFGTDDIECPPNSVIYKRDPFALQVPLVVGGSVGIDPFYLVTEIFVSPMIYPIKQNDFKHPFGLRLGFEYAF